METPENQQSQQASSQIPPVASAEKKVEKLKFYGDGKTLFSIFIVNILLSIVTLGVYHAWARAALLRFQYGETEFLGSRFTFHGTGKEIFIGILKSMLVFATVYGLFLGLTFYVHPVVGFIFFFAAIIVMTPIAIVGSLKYRTSRSSWRGIHFQYTGTTSTMLKISLKGFLLTIITFGIYGPWYLINVYKEIYSNLKFGNIRFKFTGEGGEYFVMNLKGYFLSYLTLGIYFFKWSSEVNNYITGNIRLYQGERGERRGTLKGTTTGTGYLKLFFGNLGLLIISLGLAMPWVIVRSLKYNLENTEFRGYIDFDNIDQENFTKESATGEGMADVLDMDISMI